MSTNSPISQHTIGRRRFLELVGAGGGVALLAACGPSSSGSGTTITYWTPGGSPVFCNTQTAITKDYIKAHPNIHMPAVQCGTGQQDFNEVLLARIAAGNPPNVTELWDTPVSLGVQGALEELNTLMNASQHSKPEDWPAGVLASCQFGGKTYGLPVTASTYAMWYNQDWFEQKGIPSDREHFPKTWDELRQLSKEFIQWDGDKLVSAGFVPLHGPASASSDNYLLPIWSALNGSQIYDSANRKYTLDTEENIAMMDFFLSLLNEQYKGDINTILRAGVSWGVDPNSQGQPPAFQSQKQAMYLDGSYAMGDFYASITPKFEKWNVALPPVGPGGSKVVSGTWPNWMVIPKGAANEQEAFNFLDYMSVTGVQSWFATTPDLPANKQVPQDLLPTVTAQKRGKAFTQEVISFFRKLQDISVPMWDSPIQSFASDQIASALERVMSKAASPKQAMVDAQKACQSKLDSVLKG